MREASLLPPLTGEVMESMDTYGQAKVACEQQVQQAFEPDRALIAPGSGSSAIRAISSTGLVLAAAVRQTQRTMRRCSGARRARLATQVIDVRDLAAWLIDAGSRRLHGVYNATGETTAMFDHLETAAGCWPHRPRRTG